MSTFYGLEFRADLNKHTIAQNCELLDLLNECPGAVCDPEEDDHVMMFDVDEGVCRIDVDLLYVDRPSDLVESAKRLLNRCSEHAICAYHVYETEDGDFSHFINGPKYGRGDRAFEVAKAAASQALPINRLGEGEFNEQVVDNMMRYAGVDQARYIEQLLRLIENCPFEVPSTIVEAAAKVRGGGASGGDSPF